LDQERGGLHREESEGLLRNSPAHLLPPQQLHLLRPPGTPLPTQLNMYDFHKTRQENHENAFKNLMFKRGYK
jgi:hypothetical protein